MNPVLDARTLNRCVLRRQLLLDRTTGSLPSVLERMGGLQAQYAPSMYVGLWSRLAGFRRADLVAAIADRSVVQGTLLRATIHLVSRADWWPWTIAVRDVRRQWFLRAHRPRVPEAAMLAAAERARAAMADGPVAHTALGAIVGTAEMAGIHLFVDIVRVPPSGTWMRRRANLYGLAEQWLGPEPPMTADAARELLVRRYLTAFCPARPSDIATWAGVPVDHVKRALAQLPIRRLRTVAGAELVDLDDRSPDDVGGANVDVDAPVRFLGHWDAALLTHCRAALLIREEDRPLIFTSAKPASEATFLVDGVVEGCWRHDGHRIVTEPFRTLSRTAGRAVADEAERLGELFTEPR